MAQVTKEGRFWNTDFRYKGKRYRISTKRSDKREAEHWMYEYMKSLEAQNGGELSQNSPFDQFEKKYLQYSKDHKKKNTQTHDRLAFTYLRSFLPITKLSQVTPSLLEQCQVKWKEAGIKANHSNRLMYSLKAAMRKATEWGITKEYNWKQVKELKATKSRILFFTVQELSDLIRNLQGDYKTVAYIGGRAGLRLSEIIHLSESDIDFNLHRIHITAKNDWQPKDHEKRFIPMEGSLEVYLKSILAKGSGRILNDRWSAGSLSHMMSRMIRREGFAKGYTTHTLRHTFASHLIGRGVDLFVVSKYLGHSSVSTTEEHYAHLAPSHLDASILKLPALLPPKRKK